MAQEIERKFLVKGNYKPSVAKETRITQGYLSSVPERTVRVRIKGEKGFLTIKGIGNASGASRFEMQNHYWNFASPASSTKPVLSFPKKVDWYMKLMSFTVKMTA